MIMNNKNKAALIVLIIIVIGGVIYSCSTRSEFEEFEDIEKITTFEESTYTTETTVETTTETTSDTTSTESTTEAPIVVPVFTPDDTPAANVDTHILYEDKTLKLGMDMAEVKKILGNPIIFDTDILEETTQAADTAEGATEYETSAEPTTAVQSKTPAEVETSSHRYKDFLITTKVENGAEKVINIQVLSQDITNLAGFSPIGKAIYDIELSYGEPASSDWNMCKYTIDKNSYLYFNLYEGNVETWGIANN